MYNAIDGATARADTNLAGFIDDFKSPRIWSILTWDIILGVTALTAPAFDICTSPWPACCFSNPVIAGAVVFPAAEPAAQTGL